MAVLHEVLGACVCLAERAGQVIREVQAAREAGAALKTELKDETDTRTYLTCADQRAQKVIVEGLRGRFPGINIVGEEDEGDVSMIEGWVAPEFGALDVSRAAALFARERDDREDYTWVALEDLTVFVDPLDGTREFVEGRVEACQTLIGVAIRGRPCAGVIGLPFHCDRVDNVPTPSSTATGLVVFGAVGYGIDGDVAPVAAPPAQLTLAFSKSCKDPVLNAVIDVIAPAEIYKAGGCGYKILRVLTDEAHICLLNLSNSLWDTCATSALVAAQGGKVTTLHGNPIEHTARGEMGNRFGVVVTSARYAAVAGRSHDDLCKATKALPGVQGLLAKHLHVDVSAPQACDLVRDIAGCYYTADDWSRMLCGGEAGHVARYSAADAEAERYKQSYACRIRFEAAEGTSKDVPKSVFYKRVVLRDMPYAVSKAKNHPFKLTRDIHSCKVEADFLHGSAIQAFAGAAGVKVALPFAVMQDVYASHQIDSRFGLILRDFSKEEGWRQYAHLDDAQLAATLRALAYFHAFFWAGERQGADAHTAAKAEITGKVWPVATYWDLKKQPADQVAQLPAKWEKERAAFKGAFRDAEADDATLGARLAGMAADLNREVHGCDAAGEADETAEYKKYKTVIHGDTKPANFFFRPSTRDDGDARPDVGVIDFQWTGHALGVVDVAYCVMAGIHPSLVTPGEASDAKYVEQYHAHLLDAFVAYGVAPDHAAAEAFYPRALCMRHYESAFLDLARTVIGDHWGPLTPEVLRQRDGKMAFNGYNKSLEVAVWLAARIKSVLDARGA